MIGNILFKQSILTAFLVVMLVQNTYAFQYRVGDSLPEMPTCRDELMTFFKDCFGPLDACSTCLQQAERRCMTEPSSGESAAIDCNRCTAVASSNCVTRPPVCAGDQECSGFSEKCINHVCTYVRTG